MKIFLVRHADYSGNGSDPSLSDFGKRQSVTLGNRINGALNLGTVEIWTSSAARASETAQLIKQELPMASLAVKPELWSDNWHRQDFNWLKSEIAGAHSDNLIIVSHLEYVRQFPAFIGHSFNSAGYAEGVVIENNSCNFF